MLDTMQSVTSQVEVDARALAKALRIVKAHVSRRAMPTLAAVMCVPAGDHVELTTTDLETSVTVNVAGMCDGPAFLVSHAQLSALITGRENVRMTREAGMLGVTCEGQTSTIRTMPTEDFPSYVDVRDAKTSFVDAAELGAAIGHVLPASNHDVTRPGLCGINARPHSHGALELRATDSYRLARSTVMASGDVTGPAFTLPRAAWSTVAGLIGGRAHYSVMLEQTSTAVRFSGDGWQLATRVIDADFPSLTGIAPEIAVEPRNRAGKAASGSFHVDRLQAVANRYSKLIVAAQSSWKSKDRYEKPMKLTSVDGRIVGTLDTSETGAHTSDVGEVLDGTCEVSFSPTFLADVPVEAFDCFVWGPTAPALFIGSDRRGYDCPGHVSYLLMPIRVS